MTDIALTTDRIFLTYVIPVHNAAPSISDLVKRVAKRLEEDFPGSEILLVENGSVDDSAKIARELSEVNAERPNARVTVEFLRSDPGLGNAMRAGISASRGEIVTMTGGLAFGFTDLDAVLALKQRPLFAIGSKAHPMSVLSRPLMRRMMTSAFRVAHRLLLHLHVDDPQGSFIIDGDHARRIVPLSTESGFIAQTEIVVLSSLAGVVPVEVPVDLCDSHANSSVRPISTSLEMLLGLIRLRRRLPALRTEVADVSVGRHSGS